MPDRYAVIGHPIQHSWSPFIHGLFAKQTGQEMTYSRIEVLPENLERDVGEFFATGGQGLNVTVPHKQAVRPLVRFCTPRAEVAGAINTLTTHEDGILGDNTDGAGLLTDLTKNLSMMLEGTRILLLGAGGAARGVLGPLLGATPAYVEVANRDGARAVQLADEFHLLGDVHGCGFDDISTDGMFDVIINATSASLQGTVPPVPDSAVAPTTLCYDMAYGKGDTAFTRWAKQAGAGRAELGWGMLVEQAAEAFFLWRGVKPQTAGVLEAVRRQ